MCCELQDDVCCWELPLSCDTEVSMCAVVGDAASCLWGALLVCAHQVHQCCSHAAWAITLCFVPCNFPFIPLSLCSFLFHQSSFFWRDAKAKAWPQSFKEVSFYRILSGQKPCFIAQGCALCTQHCLQALVTQRMHVAWSFALSACHVGFMLHRFSWALFGGVLLDLSCFWCHRPCFLATSLIN